MMKMRLMYRTWLISGILLLFALGFWSLLTTTVQQKPAFKPITISTEEKTKLHQSKHSQSIVQPAVTIPNKLSKRSVPIPPASIAGPSSQIAVNKNAAAGQQISSKFKALKNRLANRPNQSLTGLARGRGYRVLDPDQQKAIDLLLETLGENAKLDMDNVSGTLRYLRGDLRKAVEGSVDYQDAFRQKNYGGMAIALTDEIKTVMNVQDPSQEFVPSSVKEDRLGMVHVTLQQQYKGVPIWGAQTRVHFDADKNPIEISGVYAPSPVNMPAGTGNVDESSAVATARQSVGSTGNDFAPMRMERMIYWDVDRAPVMTYCVELTPSPRQHWRVFVSANTGQIVHKSRDICATADTGHAQDLFGQTQAVNCWLSGSEYYLVDTSKPMYEPSSQPPSVNQTKGAIFVFDANDEVLDDNTSVYVASSTNRDQWDPTAVSVIHNFGIVEEYYRQTFKRNSIDDNGMNILAIIHARFTTPDGSINQDNAFWNPGAQLMVFGDGKNYFKNLPASLDVTGHELTHGVINHTANLIYENQSGALNEHLADFFGAMIDRDEWLMGDGITIGKEALRDMRNPRNDNILSPQPMNMSQYQNLPNTPEGDNGGVHTNSGIPNYMSYLLAEGPSGIGRDKAEQILYRALTFYLTQRSDFLHYRRTAISSANDLFGENSAEVEAVKKSFDAIEVSDGGESQQTPTQGQTVDGNEVAIFLLADPFAGWNVANDDYYYKLILNTRGENYLLAPRYAIQTRPAVSGDGQWVLYVDALNNIYWTDGSAEEQWTDNNIIRSIAMSKDMRYIVFTSIYYDNLITVIDLVGDEITHAELTIPQMDGPPTALDFADIMSFNFRGDYLIYDAATIKKLDNGEDYLVWGVYSMRMVDFVSQQMFAQTQDEQIGNPILAHTADYQLLCDYETEDENGPIYGLISVDFLNQEIGALSALNDFAHPTYRGDDVLFLWKGTDNEGTYALLEERLTDDKMKLVPNSSRIVYEDWSPIAYPVGFRVGDYVPQNGEIGVPASLTFGPVSLNLEETQTITVENTGNADLEIIDIRIDGVDQNSFAHNGINQRIAPGQGITFNVEFIPKKEGVNTASLHIQSTAGTQPDSTVQLSGTGTAAVNTPTPTPTPASQPTPVQPTPTPNPGSVETPVPSDRVPIAVYEFDKATVDENGWTVIPGGLTSGEPGTFNLVDFANGWIPSSQDGKGLEITVGPSQIAFAYARAAVDTGGNPVLLRMSVRADHPDASVFLVGFKGSFSTFQNVDGSLAYNYTVSAASLVNGERSVVLVYQPDSGVMITPIIQIASTATSGETKVSIDKLEIYRLDPAQYYAGELFNSSP